MQLLDHNGVEHHIGTGDGLGRAQHTELKLIAGKGEGRGAVAVRGILRNFRQGVHADFQLLFRHIHILGAADNGLENRSQLIA